MVCSGCSRFKFLEEGKRCDPCARLAANSGHKPAEEWPLCDLCATAYEFLVGTVCLSCKERSECNLNGMPPPPLPTNASQVPHSTAHLDLAREAMNNPVNPRTYSSPSSSQRELSNFNAAMVARSAHATAVLGGLASAYGNVYARAQAKASASGMKIPKPKLLTPLQGPIQKAAPKIHVGITHIFNRFNKKITTYFNTQTVSYTTCVPWSDINRYLMFWLDGLYSAQFNYRIQSESDFTLTFTHSKATLNSVEFSADATVGDLWKASTEEAGLHVVPKSFKLRKLELTAHVNFPAVEDNTDSEQVQDVESHISSFATRATSSRKGKRKAANQVDSDTDEDSHVAKRHHGQAIRKSGGPVYNTNITGNTSFSTTADKFVVKKITVGFSEQTNLPEWLTSDETYSVWVGKEKFDSGKTKHAFKMLLGGSFYAAKVFYDLGGFIGVPSSEENLTYLKEELMRQKTIGQALNRFNDSAKAQKISVFEMRMADAFLIEVVEGPQAGLAWIVDPLLDSKKMRKFSGTDTAGKNLDFAGLTCDTFAHYTLEDSDMDFVPADIQGIVHPVSIRNIIGTNCLTLFDLMSHSKFGTMGLGDNGIAGIKKFCDQHRCNAICKKFGLQHTKQLALDFNDEIDEHVPDNQEPDKFGAEDKFENDDSEVGGSGQAAGFADPESED